MRLQKYLALCGIASRRKSEELIKEGRIKVNNIIITEMGYKINNDDIIEFDNHKISPISKVYIVLNKPPFVICSHHDRLNRKRIYDIVNLNYKLFSLGRLDYESSGLIILTNDGDFANSIIHPSNDILKEYYVLADKYIPQELILNFKKGIMINNIIYKAENVKYYNSKKEVIIQLKEGKKREIRVVFDKYSIPIKILRRISIGKMNLDCLNIKEGEYKILDLKKIKEYIFYGN